jgi:hypothetical protein
VSASRTTTTAVFAAPIAPAMAPEAVRLEVARLVFAIPNSTAEERRALMADLLAFVTGATPE